jgi:hypothetical protein
MRKFFAMSAFALGLAVSGANAQVSIRVGPPRPPREVMTARPGPGYVWTPGYYRHDGGRYNWVAGSWAQPPHPRARWVPGHWRHQHGNYVWIGGHWR